MQLPGIGEKMVEKIRDAVEKFYEALEQAEAEEARAAEISESTNTMGFMDETPDEESESLPSHTGETAELAGESPAEQTGAGLKAEDEPDETKVPDKSE
jgi:hypothetical protein